MLLVLIFALFSLFIIFNDATFLPVYRVHPLLPQILIFTVLLPCMIVFKLVPRYLLRLLL